MWPYSILCGRQNSERALEIACLTPYCICTLNNPGHCEYDGF